MPKRRNFIFRLYERFHEERFLKMIVALEDAKRRLVAMEDVLEELGNQRRIEEAKERVGDL